MNRSLIVILILLFVASTCQMVFADSALVQYSGNGHYYQRFDTERTWSSANTYCENRGGYLATMTSQAENDFVYANVGQNGVNIWLGGTDANSEGNWEWVTGETWSYVNWGTGQPDNGQPLGQDQLIFWDVEPGKWDDNGLPRGDFLDAPFICEWNQRPATATAVPTMGEWGMIIFMILAGLGSVYYLRRERRA